MKKLTLILAVFTLFYTISFASIQKQDDRNKAHVPPAPKTATLQIKDGKKAQDTGKVQKKLPPPDQTNK